MLTNSELDRYIYGKKLGESMELVKNSVYTPCLENMELIRKSIEDFLKKWPEDANIEIHTKEYLIKFKRNNNG